ncbi:tyrosine-type recombinase/integrase [Bombella pollinis]|uniref:Site-specific integrase n=1 Tax=Bombella pollinis TaxID=2967337 RepID=A0ABT3WQL1_9PROT|nr:site-specific integrase [Bombella pollinis]MCX5620114.1 site-specific integrase [Bombella pollinis]
MSKNLYQKKAGGNYYARIQINGQDVRRSLHTTDRRVALQRLRTIVEEAQGIRAGEVPDTVHQWEDAVARWADLQFGDLRPGTQKRYRTSLRQLHDHFSGRDVRMITSATVNDYTVARRRQGVSGATIRRDLMVAGRVMRVAKRAGWIDSNPVPDEMEEIKERREPIKPVSMRAMAAVIRKCSPGFRELVRFLARTGCRQEEAASLEWDQLDFTGSSVTCTFFRTKTRSPRVITLTHRCASELWRIRRQGPFVFVSREGDRYKNVTGQFRRTVQRAGLDERSRFRCHDLRHTYAIKALQAGTPIYDVARQLGHSSVKTTEMYAGWLAKRLQ